MNKSILNGLATLLVAAIVAYATEISSGQAAPGLFQRGN